MLDPAGWLEAEKAGAISINELNIYEMELKGGKCDKCGKSWRLREFKNKDILMNYYRPVCDCYTRCPICKRQMIIEIKEGLPDCIYCKLKGDALPDNRTNAFFWSLWSCYKKVNRTYDDPKTGKEKTDKKRKVNCRGVLKLQPNGKYKCVRCGTEYKPESVMRY